MPERYVGSPRHKEPWQPGARGTMCPKGVDGAALFRSAIHHPGRPGKRYNTDGDNAYCAHPSGVVDDDGKAVWHGFPVEWASVPGPIQRQWKRVGLITRLRLRG